MALSSMTGFARGHGVTGAYAWSWEIKSVNAKGFDLRLRLPPGWDAAEVPARKRASERLSRGTVYANLSVARKGVAPTVKINEPVLAAVLAALKGLSGKLQASPPSLDGILALKGVMEVTEEDESEDERAAAEAAIAAGFDRALTDLIDMRREEGEALRRVLSERLEQISTLTARAEAAPGRRAEAVKARLAEQVANLLAASQRFDSDRLHQEAVMLAAKADIREELDRLVSHVAQANKLLAEGGPVGRRLDFLAQELHREFEYAHRQVERRGADQYRPRTENRGRAVPRAGAEPGVSMAQAQPNASVARRGLMLVLSSPSGAGKTTLSRRLLSEDAGVTLSVSVTTRRMRPGEVDGRDYHFIDRRRFDAMVENGELLEYAEVFDNSYGTPTAPVMAALDRGRDVLFDIDWQGTQQLRDKARGDLASVFVLPPSIPELERRLKARAQDDYDTILHRMSMAADEMSHWAEYDYVIVNREIDQAFADVKAILAAERLKRERQPGLYDFVRGLQAKL